MPNRDGRPAVLPKEVGAGCMKSGAAVEVRSMLFEWSMKPSVPAIEDEELTVWLPIGSMASWLPR